MAAVTDITVALNYSGTATDGSDFNGVANATIAEGSSTWTFDISALTDELTDGVESFTVTLDGITGGGESDFDGG